MANTPLPVSGVVKDLDGSTLVSSIRVTLRNHTKKEEESTLTNSSGEYTLDLGGLTTQWEANDIIYLYANGSGKHAVARCKLATAQGSWEPDLYLKGGQIHLSTVIVKAVVCSVIGTAQVFSFIERNTGIMKFHVNVEANKTTPVLFGDGIRFIDGMYVIKSAAATTANNQGTGASNNIGDVSSNVGISVGVNGDFAQFKSIIS